jgi:sulfur carrier protein
MEMTDSSPTPATLLNGTPHPLDAPIPVDRFLESIGFAGKPVVVELNHEAVFPRDYATTLIVPGARIEIVTLAAGG